jgi:hypothetical protein
MPSVVQTIIDFALSPPIGVLKPILDAAGPYAAGNHTLGTYTAGIVAVPVELSFGVILQAAGTFPPAAGFVVGYDDGVNVVRDEYFDRIAQLSVQHQLQTGAWVVTQEVDSFVLSTVIRWREALPGRIGLYVSPNWSVDLFYLVVA